MGSLDYSRSFDIPEECCGLGLDCFLAGLSLGGDDPRLGHASFPLLAPAFPLPLLLPLPLPLLLLSFRSFLDLKPNEYLDGKIVKSLVDRSYKVVHKLAALCGFTHVVIMTMMNCNLCVNQYLLSLFQISSNYVKCFSV